MQTNSKEFWRRLQLGVEVLVGSRDSEQLLGARDGFRRFFQAGLRGGPTVSIRSVTDGVESGALCTTLEATLSSAYDKAVGLHRDYASEATFCVGTEEGLATVEIDATPRTYVHCWAVVATSIGVASGASGPVEIPDRFTSGFEGGARLEVPGTRRRGGILGSITGDIESRRAGFALAAYHALSSLFFELGTPSSVPPRWSD